jgi:hypothetical protein
VTVRSSTPTRFEIALVAAAAALFCMAPTAGDVGGCGKTAVELEEGDYNYTRKIVDCDKCRTCELATARCTRACDGPIDGYVRFPETCRPLRHDGDVCIRALRAAPCDAYARYVADEEPETPSECDFCRVAEEPVLPPTFADAGGGG